MKEHQPHHEAGQVGQRDSSRLRRILADSCRRTEPTEAIALDGKLSVLVPESSAFWAKSVQMMNKEQTAEFRFRLLQVSSARSPDASETLSLSGSQPRPEAGQAGLQHGTGPGRIKRPTGRLRIPSSNTDCGMSFFRMTAREASLRPVGRREAQKGTQRNLRRSNAASQASRSTVV